MRISDWSSDVCSSDLFRILVEAFAARVVHRGDFLDQRIDIARHHRLVREHVVRRDAGLAGVAHATPRGLQRGVLHRHWHRRSTDSCRSSPASPTRSEEHTSELQSLMRSSYAVFCLKKKKKKHNHTNNAYHSRT